MFNSLNEDEADREMRVEIFCKEMRIITNWNQLIVFGWPETGGLEYGGKSR